MDEQAEIGLCQLYFNFGQNFKGILNLHKIYHAGQALQNQFHFLAHKISLK